MKKVKIQPFLYLFTIFFFIACSDSNDKNDTYDPNRKVKLVSFEPDTGRIASQVLLDGENFGNDPSQMKVYFNEKQAAVIGVKDGTAYVLTPKLPGDTCKISVVIGKDSLTYEEEFYYTTSYNVSTLVGKETSTSTTNVGDFADVEFAAEINMIHADFDNNYFLNTRHSSSDLGQTSIMHIDPEAGVVRDLWQAGIKRAGNWLMDTDPRTGITYSPERVADSYFELNPTNLFIVKKRFINHPSAAQIESGEYTDWTEIQYKHSLGFCRYDNFFYTRAKNGDIIKWDPLGTNVGTLVAHRDVAGGNDWGNSYFVFSPIPEEAHTMYIVIDGRNSIYTWDIRTPEEPIKLFCGTNSGTRGHRDGVLEDAEFSNPQQIAFDGEGKNLYIADAGNHCIRKIDLESKTVSTIAGQPGQSGMVEGGPEEAKFNNPTGVCVDRNGTILIVDAGNRRVRKLEIE